MLAGTQKPMPGTKLNRGHPLAKGLVGCWVFNEGVGNKAYDLSGYGNHGALVNMAFPSTTASGWNPGRRGHAIVFDGTNDYINCGNDSSLDITDAITIEAGVKKNGITNLLTILDGWGQYWVGVHNQRLEYSYHGDITGYWVQFQSGNVITQIDTWYHIVVVNNSDWTQAKLYINGVSVSFGSETNETNIGSMSKLEIGRYAPSGGYLLDGAIDKVGIYNRALSVEEVKMLYRAPYCMFEEGELLL